MSKRGRRILLAAFGDPGHAFPVIALAKELVSRGNSVAVETAEPWRKHVEPLGIEFLAAPEFPLIPSRERPLKPYEAAAQAAIDSRQAISDFAPDAIVHDILTLAPSLIAEQLGVKWATLVPHVYPRTAAPVPPYGFGARPPKSFLGRGFQRALEIPITKGRHIGQNEYNDLRGELGLGPRDLEEGAHSRDLVMVATFPQLEYERSWPAHIKVTGPLFWEPEHEDVSLPNGVRPLVMVAPSTAQDQNHRLLEASLEGLGDLDIRVISTWNRRPMKNSPPPTPDNTNLVEWLSYSRTMPLCAAVVSHGGHGTVARTLQAGAIPIIVPAAGDQLENAARVDAARLGVSLPMRLLTPKTLSLTVERALGAVELKENASQVALWARVNDGARNAANLVEQLAA